MGAGRIFAVEARPDRQAWPAGSADEIIDFTAGDPVEQIPDLTGWGRRRCRGRGVRFPADLRGVREGDGPRPVVGCRTSGYHGENPNPLPLPLDAFGLGMNDKAIHTGLCPGGSEEMTWIFRLLQTQRIDPTPMTTHTVPFDDIEKASISSGCWPWVWTGVHGSWALTPA